MRLLGAERALPDRLALQRLLDADEARQALGAAGAGDEAELDLRQAALAPTAPRRGSGSASATSRPPPSAVPWIAAMTGLARSRSPPERRAGEAPLGGLPNSEMSAPAMKVRPSQISTMAFDRGVGRCLRDAGLRPSRTFADSAFTGGELSVSTATSPSRVRSVTELMAAICALPLLSSGAVYKLTQLDKRRWGGAFVSLFDLDGKVAVVTGSSRGIGRAIVERMAEHGAKVVVSSRKAEPCQEVADAINAKYGKGRAAAIPANISSKEQLEHLVEETMRAFGQIDVLVCNAASNPHYGPLNTITDEQFSKTLSNNIVSNHWLINLVAPQMIARKDGSIIIVSSVGGLRGSPILGAYCVSKAADFQLARNLAIEFGPHNVRVNCIAPGLIQTDFARALWENPDNLKRSTSRTPLGRIGEPDEIAGAAVLLASKAGTFMTGQAIVIDGGNTIT